MPWKSRTPVDLRTEFMNRVLRGERVTDLCAEYGISRKTGDKLKQRFKRMGVAGLEDQSRAPKVIPHRTPPEVVELIVAERKLHPTWGPKKLKASLEKRLGRAFPSSSTLGDILVRQGLVIRRRTRRRFRSEPTELRPANAPNDVWCIDYKGQFRLGDRSYCYPLTITDQFSRFILACEGMGRISAKSAREACEEVFRAKGLPIAMRSDNGVPFASNGVAGLSTLSVYWMRLGVSVERIRPAHPEENGRHERMHRTLKFETARPARSNLLQQQERFNAFVEEFNETRPHEAIAMQSPADVYRQSLRTYPEKLDDPNYPTHDDSVRVRSDGSISIFRRRGGIYLSAALAGQLVGIREERDGRWLVSFMEKDLGHASPGGAFEPVSPFNPPEGT